MEGALANAEIAAAAAAANAAAAAAVVDNPVGVLPGLGLAQDQRPQYQTAAVSMKIPPVWTFDPELWLQHIEAIFSTHRVTADNTRFQHAVAGLDAATLKVVRDIVANPPTTDKYLALKTAIIQRLGPTRQTQIKQLLCDVHLGDRKPSQLLRDMQQLSRDDITPEALRILWLQRLPTALASSLLPQQVSLAELAIIADEAHELLKDTLPMTVPAPRPATTPVQPVNSVNSELSEIVALLRDFTRKTPRDTRNVRDTRNFRRPQKPDSAAGVCFYHNKFKDKAFKCRAPCSYSATAKKDNPGN